MSTSVSFLKLRDRAKNHIYIYHGSLVSTLSHHHAVRFNIHSDVIHVQQLSKGFICFSHLYISFGRGVEGGGKARKVGGGEVGQSNASPNIKNTHVRTAVQTTTKQSL